MNRGKKFRVAVRKFGPFESAIRKQWEAFEREEKTGLELNAEAFDLHPLSETLFETAGLKKGHWDVAFINTDWVASADQSQAVLDLASLIRSAPPDDYPQGWTSSLLRLQQLDGRILGLPYHDGPECLIYRKDLFDDTAQQAAYQQKFGTPLEVPQTWHEFHQVAGHFHGPEKNLYGTVFAAFPDGHNTVYDFCLQLWTRGGELFDSGGRLRLDTPPAVQGLEYYRMMLNDSLAVHPQAREMDSVKSGLAFARGEIAMMVNWFGFAAMSETIAESKVKGRVAVAEIPHAEGCSGTSLNIYWILCIGAGSPHREVAYKFLRHCATSAMDRLLTLEGAIGCRKSTWQDPEVNRIVPFYNELVNLHQNARELPSLPRWPEIAGVIDELVLETVNGRESIAALTGEAQAKIERLALAESR